LGFAEAIIASLSQPDQLKAIAEEGTALIRESYDWVKVGADTASILKELA
jgi:glycosyltransferase involved in cell wall biosynthesis